MAATATAPSATILQRDTSGFKLTLRETTAAPINIAPTCQAKDAKLFLICWATWYSTNSFSCSSLLGGCSFSLKAKALSFME